MDNIKAAKYIKDHCLGSEVYRDGTTWNDAMVTAVEALEATPTALDHIHNVIAENEYKRGYEDGRKDAIPVEWIEKKMQWLREHNSAFYDPAYFLETMLAEWKEEQQDDSD